MSRVPSVLPALIRGSPRTQLLRAASTSASAAATPNSSIALSLPPSRNAAASAKLPALHARLNLHPSFPIETLARTLVDPTAEADARFANTNLVSLGSTLTGFFAAEHLLVQYPRLPTEVFQAAVGAYVSHPALAAVGREWGVEAAFAPTADVDAGLLQFARLAPGSDPFRNRGKAVGLETALANHVRAVFGGVYLHEGFAGAKQFFRQHIASRKLDVERIFAFEQPTRELSRLCAREGFELPVARLEAETGRRSRNAVFVVGVYSGNEKMGEGHGGSLDEARTRAAVNALKGWYLYSPVDKHLPSKTIENPEAKFSKAYIDPGEVIV